MVAQKYLESIAELREQIELMKEQVAEYGEMGTMISSPFHSDVKVQNGSLKGSKVEKYAILAADLSKKAEETEILFWERYEMIVNQLFGMHNSKYQKLLSKMYLQGMNMKQAAAECGFSYTSAINHHKNGLALFGELYAKEIEEWEKSQVKGVKNEQD